MPTSQLFVNSNDPPTEDHNESDNATGQNLDEQLDDDNGCEDTQNLEELAIVDEMDDDDMYVYNEPQLETQNAVQFKTKHATEIAKVLGSSE